MSRYILSRLAGLLGVIVVVSLITFALMHAVPGGPFDARALERQQMIPEQIKRQLNTKYGLNEPVWKQYLLFVRNAVRLDFGYSLAYPSRTVVQIFCSRSRSPRSSASASASPPPSGRTPGWITRAQPSPSSVW